MTDGRSDMLFEEEQEERRKYQKRCEDRVTSSTPLTIGYALFKAEECLNELLDGAALTKTHIYLIKETLKTLRKK